MPTYDYVCDDCGHRFEEFQSMSARPLRKCPRCEKCKLRRLIGTGAGIIFKGSGFYETDYRSDSYKKAAKADGSNGGESSASTQKAGDSTTSDASTSTAGDASPDS